MTPLSMYIHIPWCQRKCPYCDFNSHQVKSAIDEQAYIDALIADFLNDLKQFSAAIQQRPIHSIFIGGGTPSLFSAASIKRLLNTLEQHIDFTEDIEITLEANPHSCEAEKFQQFHQAGVNRLSIGVQSFNQQHLKTLGRLHNPQQAIDAAIMAKQAGFKQLNLDLMFALPQQTTKQALADLQQAIDLQPSHLSCYQLTIEPNTLFYYQPPVTPDDESVWQIQTQLQEKLKQAGYKQYEVSAYANGQQSQCRHNLNYWQFGDYLGIGAGAHGKLSNGEGNIQRYWKIKHPTTYLAHSNSTKKNVIGEVKAVEQTLQAFEFMMNALRLIDGFDLKLFEQRCQTPLSSIQPVLDTHLEKQLIYIDKHWLKPSARGQQLLDSLLQDYLPEST